MKKKTMIIIMIVFIITISVSIIYNTFPRLQLNGSKNTKISYREKYEEAGVIIKNANGNNLNKIKTNKNIEEGKIGNYYVEYTLKIGRKTLRVKRNVKIIDDISPIIKLKGKQITEISINEEYIEPGYEAIDEYDGNITEKVEVEGKIDNSNYGEYILTYKVKDKSNNSVEVNRIIKVVDEIKPVIECQSETSIFKIGEENLIDCVAKR